MNNFDWLDLARAITYAHVEAQGIKVSDSRSECLLPRRVLNTADGVSGSTEGRAAIGKIARLDGFPILVEPIPSSANSLNRSENQASPADSEFSASTSPASGARPATLAGEGEVHASVAFPSFQVHDGGTIEWLISDVERICNETK